jgi:hypothetical protein
MLSCELFTLLVLMPFEVLLVTWGKGCKTNVALFRCVRLCLLYKNSALKCHVHLLKYILYQRECDSFASSSSTKKHLCSIS